MIASAQTPALRILATHHAGVFDESAAEIVVYDSATRRLFVVNGAHGGVDVLDFADPVALRKAGQLSAGAVSDAAGAVNSVAVGNGVVAVAVAHRQKTEPGFVGLFDAADLSHRRTLRVGALPDALMFTPDGKTLVVANEGEPSDDGTVDPEGSVSVIDLSGGIDKAVVRHAGFTAFNGVLSPGADPRVGVRIHPAAASAAADLEPEYIAIALDGKTAYVSLQENNAIAVVDLATAAVTRVLPLGAKDHRTFGHGLDARPDGIERIRTEPIYSLYLPDALAAYAGPDGQTYLVTANEGDRRGEDAYGGRFVDCAKLVELQLDERFQGFDAQQRSTWLDPQTGLGKLQVSRIDGDPDRDGDLDEVFALGSRSFSIFDTEGNRVFDSGDDFERITAARLGVVFNADNDANDSLESRSDNAGPEPEGLTLGQHDGRTLAFIGLERVGGVMVYDITDPRAVRFRAYVNPRDFSVPDASLRDRVVGALPNELPGALDLGPEGLVFIPADDSPDGRAYLVVTNEVSGTTTVYRVR